MTLELMPSSNHSNGNSKKKSKIIIDSGFLHRLPENLTHVARESGDKLTSNRATQKRNFLKNPSMPSIRRFENPSKRCLSPSGDSLRGIIASPPLDNYRRVMSPPLEDLPAPRKTVGENGQNSASSVGVCCERCNNCLVEFKRQALKWTFPDNAFNPSISKDPDYFKKLEEKLHLPVFHKKFISQNRCEICDTSVKQLRQEAVSMVRSIEMAHTEAPHLTQNVAELVGSCNVVPYTHQLPVSSNAFKKSSSLSGQSGQLTYLAYLDQTARVCRRPLTSKNKLSQPLIRSHWTKKIDTRFYFLGGGNPVGKMNPDYPINPVYGDVAPFVPIPGYTQAHPQTLSPAHMQAMPFSLPEAYQRTQQFEGHFPPHMSPMVYQASASSHHSSPSKSSYSSLGPSPAASFFARAAQKLHVSSRKRRKQHVQDTPQFHTRFSQIIRETPPPAPPGLLRTVGKLTNPVTSKVRVMLRISPTSDPASHGMTSSQFLTVDPRKKQITVYDPSHCGYTTSSSSQRRGVGTPAPKMFAFDNIFAADDSLAEICSSGLTEIVQAVVNGSDGCLFSYGHAKSGRSDLIVGRDESVQTLGVIPCAIAWLFKLINEQKEKTGARFSVRVSAVEISGQQEQLKDLLSDVSHGAETGIGPSPAVYLREDPISGTQLENQSELRAPTADKAAYYLDAALAARTVKDSEEESRSSHLLFTLHIYQYRVEKSKRAGLPEVAGGRSRLHLIELGNCSRTKDPNMSSSIAGLSLSALGNVILALLNGQRHVPHRESKITQLLKDSLGNQTCRICMMAHVSSAISNYNETLQVIQLAARIHRMRRRRNKFSSASSEDSSEDSYRLRRYGRSFRGGTMGTLREDVVTASSDPDFTSSSEQSCDTVIYMGRHGISLSDKELTDHEAPPRNVPIMPRTNPRVSSKSPRRSGSRSSGDEGSYSDSRTSLSHNRSHNRLHYFSSSSSLNRIPYHSSPIEKVHSPPLSPKQRVVSSGIQHPLEYSPIYRTRLHSDGEDPQFQKPDKAPVMPRTNGNMHYRDRNDEKWIDGPAAHPALPGPEMWIDGPQSGLPVYKKSSKMDCRMNAFCKIAPEERWIDGPSAMVVKSCAVDPQMSKHARSSDANNSPSLSRAKAVKHDERDRPISIESTSSMTVEVGGDVASMNDIINEGEINMKPFVRDWVMKHSNMSSQATITKGLSHVCKKANDKQLLSPSPRNSPLVHKKLKPGVEIQTIGLPPSSSPTLRVAEWVKSVTTSSSTVVSPNSLNTSHSPQPHLSPSNVCDDSVSATPSSLCETDLDKTGPVGDELGSSAKLLDFSCSVSTESASEMGTCDNAFLTNRESIYELQFDEQLTKNLSGDTGDDETFSTHSHTTKETDNSDGQETSFLAKVSAALNDLTQRADILDSDEIITNTISGIPKYIADTRLRCPDGASNPNIICEFENIKVSQSVLSSQDKNLGSLSLEEKVRRADGQSERDSAIEALRAEMKSEKFIKKNKATKGKPPVPQKIPQPSGLPKLISKPNSKLKDENVSPAKSIGSPVVNHLSRTKDKASKSPSSQRSSSQPSSSLTSSSLPSVSSPSSNSTRSSSKDSSSQSPSHNRLPFLFNRSSKENKISSKFHKSAASKVNKAVSFNIYNCRLGEVGHRATDSDSGNDSGIVVVEHKKLLSPYSTQSKPRTPSHSSGHGSDNSSTVSADVLAKTSQNDAVQGGASSGYESMIRDSEATCTSSSNHDDTGSESSLSDKQKGDKKKSNTKRSRSAAGKVDDVALSSKAWIDTRNIDKFSKEPMELELYETDDINRMQQRRRLESCDNNASLDQVQKESLTEDTNLVQETTPLKDDGSGDRGTWSFDCKSLLCFSCRSDYSDVSTT